MNKKNIILLGLTAVLGASALGAVAVREVINQISNEWDRYSSLYEGFYGRPYVYQNEDHKKYELKYGPFCTVHNIVTDRLASGNTTSGEFDSPILLRAFNTTLEACNQEVKFLTDIVDANMPEEE